ncbi:LytR/AlgR family response regulator transcription factor [Microbulbifer variabilis]|uniref:LytR/AlgR family response regulator transcription factor n=1 Tax=Microbulbifer variabilis TaxID=266805 RepID=UPI0003658DB6|nr:response regulator [Microbulbifer variabilis]
MFESINRAPDQSINKNTVGIGLENIKHRLQLGQPKRFTLQRVAAGTALACSTNNTIMKTLIINDEPLAHDIHIHQSHIHVDLEIAEQCYRAAEGLSFLADQEIDLIPLDIHMPVLSGLKMINILANRPQVALCTAYQEYALKG